jgi:hypothetical protein
MPVKLVKDLTPATLPVDNSYLVIVGDPVGGTAYQTAISNLPSGSNSLASLTDVTISSPADGMVLVYNSVTSKWEQQPALLGGTF